MNLDAIWQEFLKIMIVEAGSRVVETWFKAVVFSNWDPPSKRVYLKAPNGFVKDWLETNYVPLITQHLSRLLHEHDISIIFMDASREEVQIIAGAKQVVVSPVVVEAAQPRTQIKKAAPQKNAASTVYQFDTFVVGPNNSLAYAACKAVADKPGQLYNPLFMYGGSGLGKTHLMHAVSQHIKSAFPKARILYQSADRFVNEFINAIRFDRIVEFEHKYKNVDVLLVDDIQFISNKEQTQEAFFHIFNALYEARKQIVLSCDSMPKDIAGLADRLRSRLDGGLVTDIQSPTLETKIAILKKKADVHQEIISDEVAHYIATRSSSNVRELEGLLIRVLAFASLTAQAINLELAQKVLERTTKDEEPKRLTLDLPAIAGRVAQHYDYTIHDLRSSKRHKGLTLARHVAMYFMKKYTDHSLLDIAAYFKRKDHSTAIHALEKIEQLQGDDMFNQELERIEKLLSGDRNGKS